MRKAILGAIATAILTSTFTGVAVNKLTTQTIERNNVVYTKQYAHKNVIDMNDVKNISKTEKGVLIETEKDGYYWGK